MKDAIDGAIKMLGNVVLLHGNMHGDWHIFPGDD